MSSTIHLRPARSARTLCGRPAKTRRGHRDWPMCKTCERIRAARGGVTWRMYDEHGWLVASPLVTDTGTNAVTASWMKP